MKNERYKIRCAWSIIWKQTPGIGNTSPLVLPVAHNWERSERARDIVRHSDAAIIDRSSSLEKLYANFA